MKEIESYFNWLSGIVSYKNDIYDELLDTLHRHVFIWVNVKDAIRAEKGKELRFVYADEFNLLASDMPKGSCSVLEVLISMALAYETYIAGEHGSARWLFWEMIGNAGLNEYDDYNFNRDEVSKIINNILERKYNRDGTGGLFPCKKTRENVRDLDLWSQMQLYLSLKE